MRFSLFRFRRNVRADFLRGRRPSVQIVRRLVRSAAATFEIRSNLFENVHQKRNRVGIGGSAGCAPLRRQRCKGKIEGCRRATQRKRNEKNAKILVNINMTTKNSNPLSDLIEQVRAIEQDAPASIDKRHHQADAKQIEAVGRLIKTILDLDAQNQKIEKTNIGLQKAAIFLGVVALLFTIRQAIGNISLSIAITIIIAIVVYFWVRKD